MPLGIYCEGGVRGTGMVSISDDDKGTQAWLPRTVHTAQKGRPVPRIAPQVHDLDGDGRPELIVLDVNHRRGPCVLVLEGQDRERPTEEGTYLLPAEPSGWCAADVEGDGDPDVVVVVQGSGGRQPGLWVLENVTAGLTAGVAGGRGAEAMYGQGERR